MNVIEELKELIGLNRAGDFASDSQLNTIDQAISDGTITTRDQALKGYEKVDRIISDEHLCDCDYSPDKQKCSEKHNCQRETWLRPVQKSPTEQAIELLAIHELNLANSGADTTIVCEVRDLLRKEG